MTLYLSPKAYKLALSMGLIPKPTASQAKANRKANKELAQRLNQTGADDE